MQQLDVVLQKCRTCATQKLFQREVLQDQTCRGSLKIEGGTYPKFLERPLAAAPEIIFVPYARGINVIIVLKLTQPAADQALGQDSKLSD